MQAINNKANTTIANPLHTLDIKSDLCDINITVTQRGKATVAFGEVKVQVAQNQELDAFDAARIQSESGLLVPADMMTDMNKVLSGMWAELQAH